MLRNLLLGFALLFLLIWAAGARADYVVVETDLNVLKVAYGTTLPVGAYACQMFCHDIDDDTWPMLSPGQEVTPAGYFEQPGLPIGRYDAIRFLLFAPGWQPIYDQTFPEDFAIQSSELPVTQPLLSVGIPYAGADGQERFPLTLKWPDGWQLPPYNGLWLMIKSSGNFAQQWFDLSSAVVDPEPTNPYTEFDCEIVAPIPPTGVYQAQAGAYTCWWWPWAGWVWPGSLYEGAGGNAWIPRCPVAQRPSVAAAFRRGKGAPFVIGGNLGNYSCWSAYGDYPNYADPLYLAGLRALGIRFLRENIQADAYLTIPTYRDIIRSHVEAMWGDKQKGFPHIIPVLAFQDLPRADTLEQRIALLVQADAQLAADYADAPDSVILENANEPSEIPSWQAWRPVAMATLTAMRQADPQGHFWTSCEGWDASAIAAEQDRLPAGLCDIYDVHCYCTPDAIKSAVGGGLPVVIGEYHDTSVAWHRAAAACPNVRAIAAWAWSEPGQDYLDLVAGQNGTSLTLTPDGNALAAIYAAILGGE